MKIQKYDRKDILKMLSPKIKKNSFYLQEIVVDGYYWIYAITRVVKDSVEFDVIFDRDVFDPFMTYTPRYLESLLLKLDKKAENVRDIIYV